MVVVAAQLGDQVAQLEATVTNLVHDAGTAGRQSQRCTSARTESAKALAERRSFSSPPPAARTDHLARNRTALTTPGPDCGISGRRVGPGGPCPH